MLCDRDFLPTSKWLGDIHITLVKDFQKRYILCNIRGWRIAWGQIQRSKKNFLYSSSEIFTVFLTFKVFFGFKIPHFKRFFYWIKSQSYSILRVKNLIELCSISLLKRKRMKQIFNLVSPVETTKFGHWYNPDIEN